MTGDAADAVDDLIDAIRSEPERLPLAEMVALHSAGHDVHIDARDDRVIALLTPRPDVRLEGLTPREHQVATLIAAGYTNAQIGLALGIRLGTVKDHVHAILAKTGFETRSQLIAAWYGGLG